MVKFKEVLGVTVRYYVTAIVVTAFIYMEFEGIQPSDLFIAVLTAVLGTAGIMIYGDAKK